MKSTDQEKILFALLRNVTFDGWTDEALRKTADGKKITLANLQAAFPNGLSDALTAFADWAVRETVTRMTQHKLVQMRVRDRVTLGVRCWLEAVTPYRESVHAAVRSSWQPARAWLGVRNLKSLAHAIWVEAGDTSTDYNYYTKRGLLIAVIASTVIFWLQDESDDFAKTHVFLDARIENVMQFGKLTGKIKNLGEMAKGAKGLCAVSEFLRSKSKRAA